MCVNRIFFYPTRERDDDMLVGSYECQGMLCDRIRCSRCHGRFDSCSRILLLKNNYPYFFSQCIRFACEIFLITDPSHETIVHVVRVWKCF